MNVKQLKEFRTKLKYAKKWCAKLGYNKIITLPFIDAELRGQCANTKWHHTMPNNVYIWYVDENRTPTERKAMWDNSIAAVDVRIAKGK